MPTFGIDEGGLSRDFITRLFQALVDAKSDEYLLSWREYPDGRLPVNSEQSGDKTKLLLEAVGHLIGLCIRSNHRVIIGPIFPSCFFSAISALKKEDLKQNFSDYSDEEKKALHQMFFPEEWEIFEKDPVAMSDEKIIQACISADFNLDKAYEVFNLPAIEKKKKKKFADNARIHIQQIREKMKEALEEDVKKRSVCRGALQIFYGMKHVWEDFNGCTPQQIQEKIQGAFSGEFLEKCLVFQDIANSDHVQRKEFFMKWTREASEEELKDFIQYATGSRSLAAGARIHIHFSGEKNGLVTAATCPRDISMPSYTSYQIFKKKLVLSIKEGLADPFSVF